MATVNRGARAPGPLWLSVLGVGLAPASRPGALQQAAERAKAAQLAPRTRRLQDREPSGPRRRWLAWRGGAATQL